MIRTGRTKRAKWRGETAHFPGVPRPEGPRSPGAQARGGAHEAMSSPLPAVLSGILPRRRRGNRWPLSTFD
jgi:hypothetical protein